MNVGAASNVLSVAPAEETAASWAAQHGCRATAIETKVSDHVVRFDWFLCDVPVVFYSIDDGGHTWPGAAIGVDSFGATTDEIDASRTMLDLWGIGSA